MTKQEFDRKCHEIWWRDITDEDAGNPKRKGCIIPGKTPRQNQDEFYDFLWLVSGIHEPIVLEIGVGHGQTEKFYREVLGAKAYISVDVKAGFNPTVCGDSMDVHTILDVTEYLNGDKVDILFIDGFHGENAVRSDFQNYKHLVRKGGYVGFHDTHRTHSPKTAGASIVWNEIKEIYPSWDIHHRIDWLVKENKDGTEVEEQIGIGVIQV